MKNEIKKVKSRKLIAPKNMVLDYNFDKLRPIAKKQILSLLHRRELSRNHDLYTGEIIKVILHEKGVI